MRLLLDTNIVSELRKGSDRRDGNVDRWARNLIPADTYLSVITLLELRAGIENKRRSDPAQAEVLDTWLNDGVLPIYAGRVLDIDQKVAEAAARLHVPHRRPAHDALIAATATTYGLILATRNEADFRPMGIAFVNPWKSGQPSP